MRGRSYPIWNQVEACIYASPKNWGAKDTSQVTVKVGTSAKNSEELVTHCTTRRAKGEYTVFTFGYMLPGEKTMTIVARKWMHTKSKEWHNIEPQDVAA